MILTKTLLWNWKEVYLFLTKNMQNRRRLWPTLCNELSFLPNQPFKTTLFQRKEKGIATISLNDTVLPTQNKKFRVFLRHHRFAQTINPITQNNVTRRFCHSTNSQNQNPRSPGTIFFLRNPRYNSGKERINLLQCSIDIWQFYFYTLCSSGFVQLV